ncbi:MAG: carboxypeptidase regulatory-like domain-containing protein [Burkholderiaceae bacterium]|nr:carboxypeptidase regulatory-like domain-containing protein [Burkholderiaceae bacterium]
MVLTSATAIILLGGILGANFAHAQLPAAQHYNQIEYVSGGIGIDESTAFKDAMSQFPLALTFAEKYGHTAAYVSDVPVVIRNKKGDTILKTNTNGPYLLVKLPAGSYKVSATYNDKTISQTANVGTKGTTRAVFEWGQ